MRLCELLEIVSAVALGIPLDKHEDVAPGKIAQMVDNIHLERVGKDLVFRSVTGKKADLTEELLEEDFRMPAVLLVSYSTETNLWSAMEMDTGLEMQELLDTKVDEPSHRYVLLGAHLITENVEHCDAKIGGYRGTTLIELIPTC